MGVRRSRVCIWNIMEVHDYQKFSRKPNCDNHEHISYSEALVHIQTFLYKFKDEGKDHYVFEAQWVDSSASSEVNAMHFTDPKEYRPHICIVDGGIFTTHQLVSVNRSR